jgi:multimeric flavodoxin WrbA
LKTVVFLASPNKNGNTITILNSLLSGLQGEVNIINTFKTNVKGCIDCKYCHYHNECFIKDDMVHIYNLLEKSDNVIIASPIYFSSFPASMKAIIDRLQLYWSNKFIKRKEKNICKKNAVVILTCGSKCNKAFSLVEETLKQVFSLINVNETYKILIDNTDNTKINKELNIQAYNIGKNISEV